MSRKSAITRLPMSIKAEVDAAIRDGRASIDEIVELIRGLGGHASRSSVHRYKVAAEESMEGFKKAQAYAAVWAEEARKDPDGKTSRLLAELLKTAAFHTLLDRNATEDAHDPKDLMFLGSTIQSIARAEKIGIERERMIREDAAKQAAKRVESVGRQQGLTAETVAQLREAVLRGG